MRVLASTFEQGDLEKILQAMRSLSYDKLLLIGAAGMEECDDFRRIEHLEGMAGHEVEVEVTEDADFMATVDQVAEALEKRLDARRRDTEGQVVLNISGGSKLLGDAALLAAFRLGVEAYHIDGRITRLPVIRGARAADRFTKGQRRFLVTVGAGQLAIDEAAKRMEPMSRQAVDRVIRELKGQDLLAACTKGGKVMIHLTPSGEEALRAIRIAGPS